MRMAEQSAALFFSFVLTFSIAAAQTTADPNLQKEDATAELLYQQQNFVSALPLYEDLHKRVPQS